VLTTPANTGIAAALGAYPIYVRYTFNYMSGFNPDGGYYYDPVYWINNFNGGDAVHGFVRGSYGFPQSLGCVELPIAGAFAPCARRRRLTMMCQARVRPLCAQVLVCERLPVSAQRSYIGRRTPYAKGWSL
jgi:hypothetical protein